MEHKLCFKILALLLFAFGVLASTDIEAPVVSTVAPHSPAGLGPDSAPGTLAAAPGPGSSLEETGQVNASNNNTIPSSGLNLTTEEEHTPLIPLSTSNNISTTTSVDFLNGSTAEASTSRPSSRNPNSPTQHTTAPSTTQLSSSKKPETSPVPTTSPQKTTVETTNTLKPDMSNHAINVTSSSAPATSSATAIITTVTTNVSATTPSTTTTQQSIQAPATKTSPTSHKVNTPSPLNVGEDTTVVHEVPALDPLLAGLVSAFIIAAVIITLLLFLKLRRRDSRPEFRRLQDLPMDDMMEDTPLSMYSY
ncbi:unnamed protein product [Knipowitschia caucasica]